MGQYQRVILFSYRNQIAALALGLGLLAAAIFSLPVQAQTCVGDPCLFYTPTPTATGTARPTPGPGTPTPVPMPGSEKFPRPNYGIPTSIPGLTFPSVPGQIELSIPAPTPDTWMTPEAFPMPDVLTGPFNIDAPGAITLPDISLPSVSLPDISTVSLTAISTSLTISYSTPATLGAGAMTGTASYSFGTGLLGDGRGIISDVVSYTDYLSGEVAALQFSGTLTITSAPDWYAPYLPRPMANIGWTFEQVGTEQGLHLSLANWSYLFGSMVSMPFSLAKAIFELFRFMGPFGLFLIWLLIIMLPAVFGFKILLFIKNTFIKVINFILTVLDWILKLWNAVPWYFGGPG